MFEEAKWHLENGHAEHALPLLRDILSCHPNQPDALNFASVAFAKLGMLDQAEQFSRQAIALRPTDAGFQLNLANRLKEKGQNDEALEAYEQAVAVDPCHVPALKNLLRFLVAEERWSKVPGVVDRLAPLVTKNAELLGECAEACIGADDKPRAIEFYQAALSLEPSRCAWLRQLARLAMIQNDVDLAKSAAERAIEEEEHPEMRSMLASLMHRAGEFDAMAVHLDAIPEDSDQISNAVNLRGMMLVSQGKIREGLDQIARNKVLAPDCFVLQATRVMYQNYDPDLTKETIRDEHFAVGRHFEETLPLMDQAGIALPHDPERRLRIGIVSPDLRSHSVAYFIGPYFEAFDRDLFDVYAYANHPAEDMVTAGLRSKATHWQNVFDLSDEALAQQIRDDRIDILIDLAGYTRDTRLPVFTARPAPIQMTYIGYPNTTGMAGIDYRLTDSIADPEGSDEDYSEILLRLPGCFLCYAIPTHAPPVEPGPVEHRGYVTFGSFNNFNKVNPDVIDAWAEILKAVPKSRMLFKSTSSKDKTAQAVVRQGLEAKGVDPERVSFASFRATPETHLAVYNDIDIALDTFPYNGTTTTCEALWMGVPVVTLKGDRHASRVGASLLSAIGFPAGIAENRDDYVLTARLLAENPGLLKATRRNLRDTLTHSTLCDSHAHARTLEHVFRTVWRFWCEQQAAETDALTDTTSNGGD
jgi:predicted O-linked N-acetylglucosamine transferase (SPINDLY family)